MRVGARILRSIKRVRKDDAGFTLIELISAVLVTTLGVVALITTLDSSRELITFAEKKEAAVHIGEQELERIQSLPYEEIELSQTPPGCPTTCDLNDPAKYIAGDWYRWDQTPRGDLCSTSGAPRDHCEQLVVEDDALDDPPSDDTVRYQQDEVTEPGPTGGVRLRIQMQVFITWVDDDCVKPTPDPILCVGDHNYKRITVAVRIVGVADGAREGLVNGGPGRPILLSTVVRSPT